MKNNSPTEQKIKHAKLGRFTAKKMRFSRTKLLKNGGQKLREEGAAAKGGRLEEFSLSSLTPPPFLGRTTVYVYEENKSRSTF